MKLAHLPFIFRRVFKNLRELVWTHILTAGIMAMTLFIFGGFILIQENLHGWLKGWGSQIQLFAYLENHHSSKELQPLLEQVRSYPEVETVRFVSHQEAWEGFKEALGAQSGMLDGLQADILPSSLEIVLKDPYQHLTSVEALAQRLGAVNGINAVEYPGDWLEKLSLLALGVQWAKWILGGFLFMATLLIVGSTVKLAILARKDEIEIMQLVGAPQGLIKAPFVIEGMIQGIIGASLSLLLLWVLFLFLRSQILSTFGVFGPREQLYFLDASGVFLLLFIGWLMGAGGSLFSLRRFLRTWEK